MHIVVDNKWINDNELIIYFANNEECHIINLNGLSINEHNFKIKSADKIIWQWYLYGVPQIQENLKMMIYINNGISIYVTNYDFTKKEITQSKNDALELC